MTLRDICKLLLICSHKLWFAGDKKTGIPEIPENAGFLQVKAILCLYPASYLIKSLKKQQECFIITNRTGGGGTSVIGWLQHPGTTIGLYSIFPV